MSHVARHRDEKQSADAADAREAAASLAAAAAAAADAAAAANARLADVLSAPGGPDAIEVQDSARAGMRHSMGTGEDEVRDTGAWDDANLETPAPAAASDSLAEARRQLTYVQANSERNAALLARLRSRRES
jgi:hypothetical protein